MAGRVRYNPYDSTDDSDGGAERKQGHRFYPPLCIQRYDWAQRILVARGDFRKVRQLN